MAQPAEIMAFRKRCKKAGYRDVSIRLAYGHEMNQDGRKWMYFVEATEPLADVRVIAMLTLGEMHYKFRMGWRSSQRG